MEVGETIITFVGGSVGGQLIMRIVSLIWPTKKEEIDVDALIQESLKNHVNFLQGQINDLRVENVNLRKTHVTEIGDLRKNHEDCESRCTNMMLELRKLKTQVQEVMTNASNQ